MQDVELWVRELEAAGWKRYRGKMTIWECPAGHLFLGPYGAWCKMYAEPELNVPAAPPRRGERLEKEESDGTKR